MYNSTRKLGGDLDITNEVNKTVATNLSVTICSNESVVHERDTEMNDMKMNGMDADRCSVRVVARAGSNRHKGTSGFIFKVSGSGQRDVWRNLEYVLFCNRCSSKQKSWGVVCQGYRVKLILVLLEVWIATLWLGLEYCIVM